MFTTLALAAAVSIVAHSPTVQTRAEVFCTSERPCNCSYYVSFCVPTCHMDPRLECGPTHRAIIVREN